MNSLLDALDAALGPRGVIRDRTLIEPWLTDWRDLYRGDSAAIIAPGSTAEVQTAVRLAGAAGVPLVPQGGNTSMVGGATPPADARALILSTRRLTAIRSLSAGRAVAEAGVVLERLHDAAADGGQRFPLSLGAKGSATIGGLVSTNAGGTQVLRFGTMRRLVLGVEAVLPDGTLHDGLSALKKDTRGYDLDQLLIGAEGTLGIVTAATLRLVPAVEERTVAWVGVPDPAAALALLRLGEAQTGEAIESCELMPDESVAAVLRWLPGARAPLSSGSRWHLLLEFAGRVDVAGLLESAMARGLATDAVIAASLAQAEAFWAIRDAISPAERAQGPAMQHDISVPVDVMPAFLTETAAAVERAFPGTRASGFGHLGDGNIHFHVRAPADAGPDWRARDGAAASRLVHDLVTAAGGSIAAEHGIGQMKLAEFARLGGDTRLALLRAIKAAVDPAGLMNPGKLIPPLAHRDPPA